MGALVAGDDPAVGEDDLRGAQPVAGEAVQAAEDAEPAAEGQAGDADARAAAGRDRPAGPVERVVHAGEGRPRADADHAVTHRHRVHRRQVDDHAGGGGAAREVVPAAAQDGGQSLLPDERDRRGDGRRRAAPHHREGPHVVEPWVGRPPQRLEPGGPRQRHLVRDPGERRPAGRRRLRHGCDGTTAGGGGA
ncbi:hypothetical protein GCM10009827_056790 [Dactylosporangium maewongense]|uniref:Uncharacterized protein n=1 Tax=Dactylosporangium maewongense TaxID=634393 RepID=A0ABP4LVI9_9ACTN